MAFGVGRAMNFTIEIPLNIEMLHTKIITVCPVVKNKILVTYDGRRTVMDKDQLQ